MQNNSDAQITQILDKMWKDYSIKPRIQVIKKTTVGIEIFGFGTYINNPEVDARLLNELPVLCHFMKIFREKNSDILGVLKENRVDLSQHFKADFARENRSSLKPFDRNLLLKDLGLDISLSLSPREEDVLKFITWGVPASYIAEELELSKRTVESYTDNLKNKLNCDTKIELMQKGRIMFPVYQSNLTL
jgi:DNA-binding CsgD family transcriptional regulator